MLALTTSLAKTFLHNTNITIKHEMAHPVSLIIILSTVTHSVTIWHDTQRDNPPNPKNLNSKYRPHHFN